MPFHKKNPFLFFVLLVVCGYLTHSAAHAGDLPKVGSNLPDFSIHKPLKDKDRKYLGIGDDPFFTIQKLNSELVMLEIVGVYCPVCHKQYPEMGTLFHRIQKDRVLSEKVKFMGIAAGANNKEVEFLVGQFKLPYPILPDPDFSVHKLLGEPRTPFTMLIKNGRKVSYAHLGKIPDMNRFLSTIREMTK